MRDANDRHFSMDMCVWFQFQCIDDSGCIYGINDNESVPLYKFSRLAVAHNHSIHMNMRSEVWRHTVLSLTDNIPDKIQ